MSDDYIGKIIEYYGCRNNCRIQFRIALEIINYSYSFRIVLDRKSVNQFEIIEVFGYTYIFFNIITSYTSCPSFNRDKLVDLSEKLAQRRAYIL